MSTNCNRMLRKVRADGSRLEVHNELGGGLAEEIYQPAWKSNCRFAVFRFAQSRNSLSITKSEN